MEIDRMTLKNLLLIILVFICTVQTLAQEEMSNRKGKLFLVPEFWLSFGTSSYIEVAPLLGYHVNNRLSAGLGPHYIYQSQKATPYYPVSYQTHVYGLKGFARFAIITNAEQFLPFRLFSELFAHMEYEGLSLEKKYYYAPTYPDDGRFIYQGFLLGGGFSQRVGMYNSVTFMVLWNLNESTRSPYSNPVFRVGFNLYF